jgi:AcrR family transcriptional regulator
MADTWQRTRASHRTRQARDIASTALSLILDRGASALTMAAVAEAAGISRQTLYRYYADIDAVLAGIAELLVSHDDHLEVLVLEQPDPRTQLDVLIRAIARARAHGHESPSALRATFPPEARDLVAAHEQRTVELMADVLRSGHDHGVFAADVEPSTDAALLIGLASAADPLDPERAVALVHRMVDRDHKEIPR